MAIGIRGINPIWWVPDLDGNPLDDTYYMWVLSNEIPYDPLPVYSDDNLTIPIENPIQFLANGTLPVDVFYEPDIVYRLEIRQGDAQNPSQDDALIYLVENYVPGTGGGEPIINASFPTDNQITNPQFAIVNFASPFTLTGTNPSAIEVAPGWAVNLSGTGTVRLEKVALNNDPATINPSNAPYALRLTMTGWDSAYLSQRFSEAGMLWANQNVSSSLTARLEGLPQSIRAQFVDSDGSTLGTIAYSNGGQVGSDYLEYSGYTTFGATTNPDVPPAAWIEYQLILPTAVDIYLTSFQLVAGVLPTNYTYEQETVERQVDHTFHYYKSSVTFEPKDSVLAGWNFGQNPWQFRTTTQTNLPVNGYVADQTIVVQQNYVATGVGNHVSAGQDGFANDNGFKVAAVTNTNQFAIIQYIDAKTAISLWGIANFGTLSSFVSINASFSSTVSVPVKMRLLIRNDAPGTISRTNPIAAWTSGQDPTFSAGWTAITPQNDPVYNIGATQNILSFNKMKVGACPSANAVIAIVIYTTGNMAIGESMTFLNASLTRNDFSIDTPTYTFDETLRRCQFYYEKSYDIGVLPGAATSSNALFSLQSTGLLSSGGQSFLQMNSRTFSFRFKSSKRSNSPTVSLFSILGSVGQVTAVAYKGATIYINNNCVVTGNWTRSITGDSGTVYSPVTRQAVITAATPLPVTPPAGDYEGYIIYHYTADARLGI